jgi:starvation-inducible DNA-binding protein
MEQLQEQMKVLLASTFAMYLKAHNFHWNVEGVNFPQYHALFETIYSDLHSAIDPIAEHIRAIDTYAPGSLQRFSELSLVKDEINIPSATAMASKLLTDNDLVISQLIACYKLAEQNNQFGLSNFIQDRIDLHNKLNWMLKASTKI